MQTAVPLEPLKWIAPGTMTRRMMVEQHVPLTPLGGGGGEQLSWSQCVDGDLPLLAKGNRGKREEHLKQETRSSLLSRFMIYALTYHTLR